VRIVERDEALGIWTMGWPAGVSFGAEDWSCESRSAKERSVSCAVPFTSGLAGSPPVSTTALESS
jgi:hypothetical protein